ncbi:cytochrome P450 2E1-like [Liolophura sinensis]|uniref:cytochrome P450 2E1-like n=1 Tax=Liolophura sinensis TaxID=3198878 RepID=UPI003158F985
MKVYGTGMGILEGRCKPEIELLLKKFRDTNGSAFDPWDSIYPAVCNVMILLLLGKRLSHSHPDFQKVLEINKLFNQLFSPGESLELDYRPWASLHNTQSQERLHSALRLRDKFFQEQIVPLQAADCSADDCILKSLLEYTDLATDSDVDITNDTVKEVFTNLLLAGTDTTATALACLLLILLHYPDVQDSLHKEMDHVLSERCLPTLSDKQRMPYLDAVLMELCRFISHVPLAVPHSTTRDTEVCGYPVRANTTVYINLWSLHHSESYWKDPWQFIPERFLNSSGKLISPDHPNRRRLMAFSAGRRVCLGETLAKNRMFLFAASILQKFRFKPEVDSALPDMDPRGFDFGLVLHPKRFRLRAVPRETET